MSWPTAEASLMTATYPESPPNWWYEERKWPAAWPSLGNLVGCQMLDVGCGTGWLGWLAKQCGAKVWCSDIFEEACHPSLLFKRAKKEALPFSSGQFDLVLTANTLHHGELEVGICELQRVLRTGGRLVSLQEPCIPCQRSEAVELGEMCQAEMAAGIVERRPNAAQWGQALAPFREVEVWLATGDPMFPGQHTWERAAGPLTDYLGGVGFICRK